MGLYDQISSDIAAITSNTGEWATTAIITDRDGNEFTVPGIWSGRHIEAQTEGGVINTMGFHFAFHQSNSGGMVLRNSQSDVDITGYLVELVSSGITKKYLIKEHHPNETTGLIVCILSGYE